MRRSRRRIRPLSPKRQKALAAALDRACFRSSYRLEVFYRGYDHEKDRAIEKAVGKNNLGSGMALVEDLRDLDFEFKTERSALAAAARVKKAVRGVRFMLHSSKRIR